jgi:hypothetical protein
MDAFYLLKITLGGMGGTLISGCAGESGNSNVTPLGASASVTSTLS